MTGSAGLNRNKRQAKKDSSAEVLLLFNPANPVILLK
jgi:hypothetical protein